MKVEIMHRPKFGVIFLPKLLFLFIGSIQGRVADPSNPISAHVLELSLGRPAPGILVSLYQQINTGWSKISTKLTDNDGRVGNLISQGQFRAGTYMLTFETQKYYRSKNINTFYPYIPIVFDITATDEHYHVPILLSAFGYSTYRGS